MIRSFKLRYLDHHVRVVPTWDLAGAPFSGPGVDVLGDDAKRAFILAKPIEDWLRAREPGLALRSLSADISLGRFLVSFDDLHIVAKANAGTSLAGKPVALRIVPPDSSELLDAAKPLVAALEVLAKSALERRARRSG
ncbi:hypothetical protein BH09MYX1_BH09MYX1_34410 [soil metagenome]